MIKRRHSSLLCLVMLLAQTTNAVFAQSTTVTPSVKEPIANTLAMPKQILRTGVSLNTTSLSPNTLQLANIIGLTPILGFIQTMRSKTEGKGDISKSDTINIRTPRIFTKGCFTYSKKRI